MTISLNKMKTLTADEVEFIYKMLVTHGYMPEAAPLPEEEPRKNQNYKGRKPHQKQQRPKPKPTKKFIKKIDKSKPNLMNFDDPLWEDCEEINWLIFRVIMEKTKQ